MSSCQDLSKAQKRGPHSVHRGRLLGTLTLRLQLGKYIIKPFPRRNGEIGAFAFLLCSGPRHIATEERGCSCTHYELLLCLLRFCGTCECKYHWLSEFYDLGSISKAAVKKLGYRHMHKLLLGRTL